jgi:hypothetical protein
MTDREKLGALHHVSRCRDAGNLFIADATCLGLIRRDATASLFGSTVR